VVWIRGSVSGSVPKCHGSPTLVFISLAGIDSRRDRRKPNQLYAIFVQVLQATNATDEEERKITVDDEMPPVLL
jgi:hypothetical protein